MKRELILLLARFGWSLCPDGWHGDPQTDWCYKPFESGFEKSWNAAESHCQSFGGDLTAINSKRQGSKISLLYHLRSSRVSKVRFFEPVKENKR